MCSLQLPCSNLPQLIHHASHPQHSLTLLPRPAYPSGCFTCNACGHLGDGFSYHCTTCNFDLHSSTCASMAPCVAHHAHVHMLTLAFFPPYDSKMFSCNVCGRVGDRWLYRCALCEFDAHLECAVGWSGLNPLSRSASTSLGRVQPPAQVQPGMNRMGSTGRLLRQVMNGIVAGATQQIGQTLVGGIMGGGGGDGGNLVDGIMGGGDGIMGGGGGDGGSGSTVLDIGGQILGSFLGGDTI